MPACCSGGRCGFVAVLAAGLVEKDQQMRCAYLLAVMVFSSAALAAAPEAAPLAPFETVDGDHDGHISYDEFHAFALADIAKSGGLRAKMAAVHPDKAEQRIRERFEALDSKHQGYITQDEWHH
jgi:Ca2+-binding EF-hand superfamily protein